MNFADTESNHFDIALLDSVDFLFPDSASNHTYNKFVIGVKPNGAVGSGQYIFTIFETQLPHDSIRIYFNVEVYTSIGIEESISNMDFYPNPASDYLFLPDLDASHELSLHSSDGREVKRFTKEGNPDSIALGDVPSGTYFLQVKQQQNQVQVIKIIIQH